MECSVYEDCRTLIDNFTRNENAKYKIFYFQWKAMMFQHIYSAQSSAIEIVQTTSAIFNIAKHILCSSTTMLRRVGALFLLYSIYFKQPTERFVRVEVSLESWCRITNFIGSLEPVNKKETLYVFLKLCKENAFRISSIDMYTGLENFVNYDEVELKSYSTLNTMQCISTKLLNTKTKLPALIILEEGYNEMKEIMISQSSVPPFQTNKSLPPSNALKELRSSYENIVHIVNKKKPIKTVNKYTTLNSYEIKSKLRQTNLRKSSSCKAKVIFSNDKTSEENGLRNQSAKTVFTETLPSEILHDISYVHNIL